MSRSRYSSMCSGATSKAMWFIDPMALRNSPWSGRHRGRRHARGGLRGVREPEEGQRVAVAAVEEEVLPAAGGQVDRLDQRHAEDVRVEVDRPRHVPAHEGQVVDPPVLERLGHAGLAGYAADFSRMWTPQAEPRPMTWARPTLAPSIWRSPASPRRWWQTSQMLAMPVAAIGWPFDSQAAGHVHRRLAVAPRGAAVEEVDGAALLAEHEVVVVHELGGGEAVVQLDEVEVLRADAGLLVGLLGGRSW